MIRLPQVEKPIVWRLFFYSLTVATSYIVARTVGDSLFLSRVGNDQLALVFVIAGCTTAVVASVWYWLTRKLSISRTIQWSGLIFATFSLLAWFALPHYHHSFWLLAGIYLLAEVRGCVNAINVVSALNSKLGREASKPSWALVGLAAPMAGVIVGGLMAYESSAISLRSWLLIGCILDLASFGIGWILARSKSLKFDRPFLATNWQINQRLKTKKYVCSDKFRFWIGILICSKVIVLTFVSFEWKTAVNSYFQGDAGRLVQFFGVYYGLVGLATVVTQYFLTSRLLIRRNLKLPILLMPVALLFVGLFSNLGVGLLVGLIVATIGKSLEIWRRSVHDTTLNSLYTKIRRNQRRAVIAVNSALVKPLSEVVAACVILFGTAVIYRPMMLLVAAIWLVAGVRLIRLVRTTNREEAMGGAQQPAAMLGKQQ